MGKPYFRQRDGMWVVQIELPLRPDGKRRRKYVTAKRKPDVIAKARVAQKEVDRAGDMLTNVPTLATWLDRWLVEIAAPSVRPKTLANYTHMASIIKAAIGRVKVDKMTPAHVRALADYITGERGLSPTTARNAHAVLRKSLNDAMTEGVATRNVAELVKAPTKAHYEADYLSAMEAARLLMSVAHEPRDAIRWSLALVMGMRQGECLGLRVDHVDLDAEEINVEWQLQQLDTPPRRGSKFVELAPGTYLTPPKTGAGARILPMPDGLADAMRLYLPTLPGPDSFVCGPGIVDERADARAWKRALRNAGLREVRLHSARHTALTMLAAMGVPDHVRQAIAGHASAQILQAYTHAEREEVRNAIRGSGRVVYAGEIEG